MVAANMLSVFLKKLTSTLQYLPNILVHPQAALNCRSLG